MITGKKLARATAVIGTHRRKSQITGKNYWLPFEHGIAVTRNLPTHGGEAGAVAGVLTLSPAECFTYMISFLHMDFYSVDFYTSPLKSEEAEALSW